MATRSSIKRRQKSKLGAAVSLAAGGVALSVDAGGTGGLDFGGNAAIEAAFRLLEEGQLQALNAESDEPTASRTQLNVTPAGMAGGDTIQDTIAQLPAAEAADTVAMGAGQAGDLLIAQADTAAAASAAAETSAAVAAEASAAAGAGAAGAGAVTGVGTLAPIAAIGPLGAALGVGAVTVAAVAAADGGGGSAGSDLNDDDPTDSLAFGAKTFSVSGSLNDQQPPTDSSSTEVGAIGSSFLDDSFGNFFS